MSTVGTIVRDPGVVRLPCAVNILRGQLVSFTPGAAGQYGTAKVPAAAADKIYGIATTDYDSDSGTVDIAVKGGYTLSLAPTSGQTFGQGQIAYQDAAAYVTITTVGTAGTTPIVGWIVNPQPDSLGNYEVAFFTDKELTP